MACRLRRRQWRSPRPHPAGDPGGAHDLWRGGRLAAGDTESVGFLSEAKVWIESAATQLRRRREELSQKDNIAERLASALVGRHVLCQGDTSIGATAAERWKAQINQNAKQAASASEQPNASHNEAVAWDCRNDLTMHRDAAVLLRHGYEDPRVSQRIDRLAQYLNGKIPVHSVRGEGDTRMAVLMDLVMIGDYTSLHLAGLNGVDPSSVKFISHTVKEGLAPPSRERAGGHRVHMPDGSVPLAAIRPARSQSA